MKERVIEWEDPWQGINTARKQAEYGVFEARYSTEDRRTKEPQILRGTEYLRFLF
jgi:hypothetical protein